ncbi:probable transmembrane reductase CYB561D1 [Trichomycterus rosablanca]|uniref:probable transmembrane reductase CYB561D1 n=1 Tax=Trichomycterus rosablanca TaxID=2290929 RepID=UPI002F359763
MRGQVEYSPVGEGLGMREYWLYACMRKVALVAAHCVTLGFTLLIGILSRPATSHFSWHPLCMVLAFCLCMTEGILLFSAEGTPCCFKSRKGKIRMHWILQALLLVFAATGLGFMVVHKNLSSHPHLATWHGLLGVSTLVATVLQMCCGLCLLFPQLVRTAPVPRLRLYHATCGLMAYLLATVTVVTAMFSDWFQATIKGPMWYVFLVLPLIPALVVMNQITNAFLPRKKLTM